MDLVDRYRNRTRDMARLVLVQGASVENDHIVGAESFEEFLETNRFGGCSVAEVLINEALEISEPVQRNLLNGCAYVEDFGIGEAVIDEETLLAAFDQCGLLQCLKMLRGIGNGQSRFGRERVDRAFRLGQELEEFQPVWTPQRFADSAELTVQAILEISVRRHLVQVINRSLEQLLSTTNCFALRGALGRFYCVP